MTVSIGTSRSLFNGKFVQEFLREKFHTGRHVAALKSAKKSRQDIQRQTEVDIIQAPSTDRLSDISKAFCNLEN